MKISITGHTNGIGLGLYNHFDDCIGFSKSNGYDISNESDRNKIVEESLDSDVFINNAYCEDFQTNMFLEIYNKWRYEDKLIINIVSGLVYSDLDDDYSKNKKHLYESSLSKILNEDRRCRIFNINPGYIKTDMVRNLSKSKSMMEVQEFVSIIDWLIKIPSHIEVGELSVWVNKNNNKFLI